MPKLFFITEQNLPCLYDFERKTRVYGTTSLENIRHLCIRISSTPLRYFVTDKSRTITLFWLFNTHLSSKAYMILDSNRYIFYIRNMALEWMMIHLLTTLKVTKFIKNISNMCEYFILGESVGRYLGSLLHTIHHKSIFRADPMYF